MSLLECVTGELFGNRIRDIGPAIGDNDRVANAGEGDAKVLLAPAQALLRTLLLGDVASDFRCADNPATTVFDWGDRKRDVHKRCILPPPHRLKMFDPLSPPEPFENFLLLIDMIGRNQHQDGMARYFGGSIAENPFGSLVPTGDDPIQVLADNGVI